MSIVKVHVATSQTYVVKNDSDDIAVNFCRQAQNVAKRHKGIVLDEKKVQDGEYLLVVYFSNANSTKIWKRDLESRNVELESVSTSRTYIIKDGDGNDIAAKCFCSTAKDTASHYMGSVVTEKKLQEGAYLLVVYFSNEGLMNVWETSMGIG